MDREEISGIVTEIMCDVFDLDTLEYSDTLSADEIEEWDSLSHIRFIVAVEKRFGFRFSSAEIEGFSKVGDLVDSIATHTA